MQAKLVEFLRFRKNAPKPLAILCEDSNEALSLADAVSFCGYSPIVLPDFRANDGEDLRPYSTELSELLSVLSDFYNTSISKKVLIAPFRSVKYEVPNKKYFDSLKLEFATNVKMSKLKETLLFWGYSFVDTIEAPGEVSFRGDIADIFAPNHEKPLRFSFFDNEIESIRYFDQVTQKSEKEELETVAIRPALFSLDEAEYLELNIAVKESKFESLTKDIFSLGYWLLKDKIDLLSYFEPFFASKYEDSEFLKYEVLPNAKSLRPSAITDALGAIELHKNKKVTIIAKSKELLERTGIDAKTVNFIEAPWRVNLQSDAELIISLNPKMKPSIKKRKRAFVDLGELKCGDYVVHETYGVGIFEGLEAITVLGATKEFAKLRYQNDDKLLVPVENLESIDRYLGEAGGLPILDKLGKASFAKLKAGVKDRLFEIAKDIIDLAAERELIKGVSVSAERPELALFAKSAGFEYTLDQERAISDILADMSSGKAMDRLLSGDVGFGKTEVAMNAILAAHLSGFSSVFIAPTAILANQHYATMQKRLTSFGLSVARIDRFVSAKDKKEILELAGNGKIDVLVGTHAILGVEVKRLGLAILDEEHKFGVKQKEKIKNLKSDIHILSMSATPIPRTLNLALSKIKGVSELLTPPKKRLDARTFVKIYSESLFKESALRELRRGGQIFYVHNRIASIEGAKKSLQALLPNLKLEVLHSKITPDETEKILLDFSNRKFDCLISTNIIESGIDMPNVNTIFIDDADMFGVADLHQLRGRIGRSDRQGYCYFFVKDFDALTDEAKRRLSALESNSYLGSGAALAYHDLEIRGGGNIVGEAQSGHIKQIGYSLYLRMLEDAINTLTGQILGAKRQIELKLSVSAYLNERLIPHEKPRLELYRRLSGCESAHEISAIEEEMIDRFGTLDEITKRFLKLIEIKILGVSANIASVSNFGANITITKEDGSKLQLTAPYADDDDVLDATLKALRARK